MPSTKITYPNGIKCPSCDASYSMANTLKKHMETYHSELFKNGSFVCFQCFSYFKTLSDVRKHQWEAHKNTFREVDKPPFPSVKIEKPHHLSGRKRSKASIAKFKATLAAKRVLMHSKSAPVKVNPLLAVPVVNGETQGPGQLSAIDLLQKFKSQRDLMITVCNMIEGVINQ